MQYALNHELLLGFCIFVIITFLIFRIRLKMSDDEREIDVESESEESNAGSGNKRSLDKRAQHSAFERKRRDHIKDSFEGLKNAIPTLKAGHNSSRAQILKKASEYIQSKRRIDSLSQTDMDNLKGQNNHLEAQIRVLERARNMGNSSGKSAAEILTDQGLLAEGESLPTLNDLEPSVSEASAVAPGQSLLLNNSENVDSPRKKPRQF